jgi:hypothetical protein
MPRLYLGHVMSAEWPPLVQIEIQQASKEARDTEEYFHEVLALDSCVMEVSLNLHVAYKAEANCMDVVRHSHEQHMSDGDKS